MPNRENINVFIFKYVDKRSFVFLQYEAETRGKCPLKLKMKTQFLFHKKIYAKMNLLSIQELCFYPAEQGKDLIVL